MRNHPLITAALCMVIVAGLPGRVLADDYPRDPRIDVLHYVHELTLGDDDNIITGRTRIDIRARLDNVDDITLDLIGRASTPAGKQPDASTTTGMTVTAVSATDAPLSFTHADNRVHIDFAAPLARGATLSINVQYQGAPADGLIISQSKHGDRTFFSDNFPNRARHWFPGIDHPYDKATCEFIINAPNHYQVIANGIEIEESDLSETMRRTHYRQSIPISTYLMVIGVAQFAVQHLEPVHDVPLQTWVYAQDRDAGFADFSQASKPLAYFIDNIGPYPYEKLANVQSRTRYGGMENASAIFYSERAVSGRGGNMGLIAHEIAHQWFGDSVTTSDWNHVWLSEGFATYFTHLYNEFDRGREALEQGMARDRTSILRYHRRNPDAAIVDPRVPVERILSTLAYQKGGWVLHMLRRQIGDDAFWRGMRSYYKQYRDSNALTADFREVMEQASEQKLDWFFEQWVFTAGHPTVRGSWTYDATTKTAKIAISQEPVNGRLFRFPIDLALTDASGNTRVHTVELSDANHEFTLSVDAPPASLQIDPNAWLLADVTIDQVE